MSLLFALGRQILPDLANSAKNFLEMGISSQNSAFDKIVSDIQARKRPLRFCNKYEGNEKKCDMEDRI